MKAYNQNKKSNISKFVPINEIINYEPPIYTPNWDGSFSRIKSGKSSYFRPNKEFSTFNIDINIGSNGQMIIKNLLNERYYEREFS